MPLLSVLDVVYILVFVVLVHSNPFLPFRVYNRSITSNHLVVYIAHFKCWYVRVRGKLRFSSRILASAVLMALLA